MFFHKTDYPEENDLVLCTVTSVQFNSVFCTLDHYGKSGMIHISEVAPGRIRNIRDYVVEGKKVVCKVLRINEERGHIDLSLRRVNDNQRRSFNMLIKQEQKAEKIIENLAAELKQEPKKVYDAVAGAILKEYEFIHMAFQDHVDEEGDLANLGIPKEYMQPLIDRVVEKIKPKSVTIRGTLSLATYEEDGISLIRTALEKAEALGKEQLHVSYLGSGNYKFEVTADEYKDAEELLGEVVKAASSMIEKSQGGVVKFVRA